MQWGLHPGSDGRLGKGLYLQHLPPKPDLTTETVRRRPATKGQRRIELKPSEQKERMSELKRDIALDRYDVDSRAVAGAILTKLQLVKRCQMVLQTSDADRMRMGPSQARPAR